MKCLLPLCLCLLCLISPAAAQIFERPNYSLTSHPTLEITSIERWEDQMVLNLTLKNERYGGAFCIDSSTVLRNSLDGKQYSLTTMEGIPACPDTYRFKSIGESISFNLTFPPVADEVKYIDLIEQCEENCVSIKYILLDEELNSRLWEGIQLYELGRPEASLRVFEDILNTSYDGKSPVFGTVYLYLVAIHYELGSAKDARRVFGELRDSEIIGREDFIETARETGIIR